MCVCVCVCVCSVILEKNVCGGMVSIIMKAPLVESFNGLLR